MLISNRVLNLVALSFLGVFAAHGADGFLPLPEGEPVWPGMTPPAPASLPAAPCGTRFLKPTKSIKPPMAAAGFGQTVAAVEPQVNAPTAPRLRRLILMPGDLSPADIREKILAGGQGRTPVTVVGMEAPAPVLTNLAAFFGSDVNADTQKKLLDTVRQGMTTTSKVPRRVEVVGWLPSEGVMAVAVYPES